MENSCFIEIPLEPSPFKPDDGGAERGVGWLQKYGVSSDKRALSAVERATTTPFTDSVINVADSAASQEHIQRSPAHVTARNARIQTDKVCLSLTSGISRSVLSSHHDTQAIKAEAPPDSWVSPNCFRAIRRTIKRLMACRCLSADVEHQEVVQCQCECSLE